MGKIRAKVAIENLLIKKEKLKPLEENSPFYFSPQLIDVYISEQLFSEDKEWDKIKPGENLSNEEILRNQWPRFYRKVCLYTTFSKDIKKIIQIAKNPAILNLHGYSNNFYGWIGFVGKDNTEYTPMEELIDYLHNYKKQDLVIISACNPGKIDLNRKGIIYIKGNLGGFKGGKRELIAL